MRDVTDHPYTFEVGDSSPLEALEAFVAPINTNCEQLQMGHLTEEKALLAAYRIENTSVEGKYAEIMQSRRTPPLSLSLTLHHYAFDICDHNITAP
jgi:hypothetical protein